MDNYDLLILKLDAFIRKYYLNNLLRGSLIFIACTLAIFLLLSVGEYYFYFSAVWKILFLIVFGGAGIVALGLMIIKPLFQMQKLGKIISHEQAAVIIGKYFPNIQDKLLNILQLKKSDFPFESEDLVHASIEQKTAEISVIPFSSAIKLKQNKKYIPYVTLASLIVLTLAFLAPQIFKESSDRWMQPNVTFQPPAPFQYKIKNNRLEVPMNGDFTLEMEIDGDKIPDQVFMDLGTETVKMESKGKTGFTYEFQNVHQSINFQFVSGKVKSSKFLLKMMEWPLPEGFEMELIYPKYTGLRDQQLKSFTDVIIPVGTKVIWNIQARFTEEIQIAFGSGNDRISMMEHTPMSSWNYEYEAFQDTSYGIYLSNHKMKNSDSFNYNIQVIADEHPKVLLEQFKDSISGQQVLLTGQASDDYGLLQMQFTYIVFDRERNKIKEIKQALPKPSGKIFSFQHYFDIGILDLQAGQEVEYFVEAWDNDGINGSKKGISEAFHYRMLAKTELDSAMQKNAQQINQSLSSSSEQSKNIQKDIDKLQTQMLQQKEMGWEQEQNMKSLMDKQTQLKDQVKSIQKRFEEQQKQALQKEYSPEIEKKQEALKEQIDHLVNKELADQLKKLQELLEEKNKESSFNALKEIQEQNKLFNMDLDRIQELMKKLEMQMKLEDLANKLNDLAKEERNLENKTEKAEGNPELLAKEQEEIRKKLEELLKEDFSDIERENKKQSNPEDLEVPKELGDHAAEEMQNSKDELDKNQSQNAQKSQNKAAESLEKMSKSMMDMASGMDMQQLDIDIKAVRQLLTNLIRYSFDQEDLMEKERYIPITSPLFPTHAQKQNVLKANAEMIKDSLFALSKRVFELGPTINRETSELTKYIHSSLEALESRRVHEARTSQRFAMSHANNLALLLNESLENMMQMQMEGTEGSSGEGGEPQKSGKGNAGEQMKDIITGQQQLGEGMKSAQKEGGQTPGDSGEGESGEGGDSDTQSQAEQLARLAQQQSALRKQIGDLSSQLNSSGGKGNHSQILKEIQDAMDKNETDLVNKRLNSELLHRQQDILTRLLEAEKSIRNQEEDDKRSAQAGKDLPRAMPAELQKYLKERQSFFESYKTTPAPLKPFYKKMSDNYLNEMNK